MSVIEAEKLSKTFRVRQKEKGMRGSIQAVFHPRTKEVAAVDGVSFSVEEGEVLYRPQRRRKEHYHQDAHRDSLSQQRERESPGH